MKKLLNFARVLIPAAILASFIGCSSGLEGDSLKDALLLQQTANVVAPEVVLPPPSLTNTDWGGVPSGGGVSDFVALHFFISGGTNAVTLIKTDLSRTTYSYTYTYSTGSGTIGTSPATRFTIDAVENYMNILDATLLGATAQLKLLPKLDFQELLKFVGEGPTPRYDYSSIEFVTVPDPTTYFAQMTFEDGTFPQYELTYYDDVAVGTIGTLGMFYLDYNSDGAINVNFPNFYGYHMNALVTYNPSPKTIDTLEGTTWVDDDGLEVSFTSDEATFSDDKEPHPYVYNDFRAGGVGKPTTTPTTEGGSFQINYEGVNPLEMLFYNFRASGSSNTFKLLQP